MKLPGFKRLNKNDYAKEFKDLVDRLSVSLNIGIETLYTLANNNISLADNTLCDIKEFTVSVDSSGIPKSSLSIPLSKVTKVIGTEVIFGQNQTNSNIYATGQPFITYTQNGSSLTINQIAGLPADNVFLLRTVIYG